MTTYLKEIVITTSSVELEEVMETLRRSMGDAKKPQEKWLGEWRDISGFSIEEEEAVYDLILAPLPGLRRVEIVGSFEAIKSALPGGDMFTSHTALEQVRFDSRRERYDLSYREEEEEAGRLCYDPFDISKLRSIAGEPLSDYQAVDNHNLSEVVIDVSRTPSTDHQNEPSYALRLFGHHMSNPHFDNLIQSLPLSELSLVSLSDCASLSRSLRRIPDPSIITHLTLFAIGSNEDVAKSLSLFENLSSLALGGDILSNSTLLYDYLEIRPLEFLHLGPGTSINAKRMLEIVSTGAKTLRSLTLDNIDAHLPSEVYDYIDKEDHSAWRQRVFHRRLEDWVLPDWTMECTEDEVRKLKAAAEAAGIKVTGSTFFGLEITETKEYKDDLEREAEVLQEQEERYNVRERRRAEWKQIQEEHDEVCSCKRKPFECNEFRGVRGLKQLEEFKGDKWWVYR
ncbi:hypothetical protein JCM5353_008493 [Sporobolomyces roseus]